MDEAAYTVGALARSSGLTVRTLHHWDAIGLLVALIRAFTGGDPGITASLKRMYSEQGAEQASRGAMPAGLQDYVGRAMAVRGT